MKEMNMDRLEELFDNQEFVNALKKIRTSEELVRFFAANGVAISAEDAQSYLNGVEEGRDADELDPEMLDMVAGGKSKCFFHGALDAAFGKKKEADGGFWYKLGYGYGSLFR